MKTTRMQRREKKNQISDFEGIIEERKDYLREGA
jgi:hypothetical protein